MLKVCKISAQNWSNVGGSLIYVEVGINRLVLEIFNWVTAKSQVLNSSTFISVYQYIYYTNGMTEYMNMYIFTNISSGYCLLDT